MTASYKAPVNFRSMPVRVGSPEAFTVTGGYALLAEAPADPTVNTTTVTVGGNARTRVDTNPAAGQYRILTQSVLGPDAQQHTEWLPVLQFHSSDNGLAGTADYYGSGTILSAEFFAMVLAHVTPLVGVANVGALPAATMDTTQRGRPGDLAFLASGAGYYSTGSAWVAFGAAAGGGAGAVLAGAATGAAALTAALTTHGAAAALAGAVVATAVAAGGFGGVAAALAGAVTAAAVLAADLTTGAGGGTAVSDNFNRANSGTLGANWTALTGFQMPGIASNSAHNPGSGSNPGAYWSANTFANNQYSEIKIDPLTWVGRTSAYPAVRCGGAPWGDRYYVMGWSEDDGEGGIADYVFEIRKRVTGSELPLGSVTLSAAFADWVLRLEASGTTITFKTATTHGGTYTTRKTVTDSDVASGKPGFLADYVYDMSMGDDWYGGDL